VLAQVDQLAPIARELGLSLPQLALAWCLRRQNVASVIVGVTRAAQLEENAKASGVKLSDDVIARLDAIAPAA
jgi:aryl-alcohol dehydrogenase-like predicted oxidoreductase